MYLAIRTLVLSPFHEAFMIILYRSSLSPFYSIWDNFFFFFLHDGLSNFRALFRFGGRTLTLIMLYSILLRDVLTLYNY